MTPVSRHKIQKQTEEIAKDTQTLACFQREAAFVVLRVLLWLIWGELSPASAFPPWCENVCTIPRASGMISALTIFPTKHSLRFLCGH
jgi:hypothetical protein